MAQPIATVPRNHVTPLSDLQPMMKDIDCEVIVLAVDPPQYTSKAQELMYPFTVSDNSGSIDLRLFSKPDFEALAPGDIIRIYGAEAKMFRSMIYLTTSKGTGRVRRVGEDVLLFNERPNHSRDFTWAQNPSGQGVIRIDANSKTQGQPQLPPAQQWPQDQARPPLQQPLQHPQQPQQPTPLHNPNFNRRPSMRGGIPGTRGLRRGGGPQRSDREDGEYEQEGFGISAGTNSGAYRGGNGGGIRGKRYGREEGGIRKRSRN